MYGSAGALGGQPPRATRPLQGARRTASFATAGPVPVGGDWPLRCDAKDGLPSSHTDPVSVERMIGHYGRAVERSRCATAGPVPAGRVIGLRQASLGKEERM